MSEVEERIRRELDELAASVPVDAVAPPQIVSGVRRSRRRRATALTAGCSVIVAVLVAVVAAAVGGPSAPPVIVAGPEGGSFELSDPGAAKFEMSALAPSPLSPRADMTGVWTGEELIVWGGTSNGAVAGDGAAYSPASDSWRRIADGPLSARTRHMAVWTGREMVVWGGTLRPAGPGGLLDGAAYDPTTDTWRLISSSPPGTDRTSAATAYVDGSAVFGGGGSSTGSSLNSVLVYDVGTDTWTQRTVEGGVVALAPFDGRVAIATIGSVGRTGLDVVLLDPTTGESESLPEFPEIPTDGYLESVGLAGSESGLFAAATVADSSGKQFTKVAVFAAGAGKWRGLRTYSTDAFAPGSRPQTVYSPGLTAWTGTWLLGWSHAPTGVAPGTDRVIDRIGPDQPVPCGAAGVTVWTGDRILQWGGQNCRRDGPSAQVDTGVAVRIATADSRGARHDTTSTSVPAGPTTDDTLLDASPGDGDLRPTDLVGALGDDIADCCQVTDGAVEFTWTGGAGGSLGIDVIDPSAPSDPRVGMTDPQYVTDSVGTFLVDATQARFDCGSLRYTLRIAGGPPVVEAVAALSTAAGCVRVSIAAPTGCLDQLTDPAACVEPES
jgi:hypothetical protein